MNKFFKKVNTTTLLYYLGRFISTFSTLWFRKHIGLGCIGDHGTVHDAATLLAKFDFGQSITYFFPTFAQRKQARAAFLHWSLAMSTLWYGLIASCFIGSQWLIKLFWQTEKSGLLVQYALLVVTLGYLVFLSITLKAWARSCQQIVWPNFFQHILLRGMMVMVMVGLVYEWYDFSTFLWLSLLPYTINLVIMVGYLAYLGELSFSLAWGELDATLGRRFFLYSFFVVLGTGFFYIMPRIDMIMIQSMLGSQLSGAYKMASMAALLVEAPARVFKQATAPHLAEYLGKNKRLALAQLYKRATFYQLLFGGGTLICLLPFLATFLHSSDPELMALSQKTFYCLAFGQLIYYLFSLSSELLFLSQYFHYTALLTSSCLLVGIGANFYLIKLLGLIGAAIATTFVIFLSGLATHTLVHYKLGVRALNTRLLALFALLLVLVGGEHYLLHHLFAGLPGWIAKGAPLVITLGSYTLLAYPLAPPPPQTD